MILQKFPGGVLSILILWLCFLPITGDEPPGIIQESYSGFYMKNADPAFDVVVRGNYAYVASAGLKILDVTHPSSPEVVGFLPSPHKTLLTRLFLAHPFIYMNDGKNLSIGDVSDPKQPKLLGSFTSPNSVVDLAISDPYVFLAEGEKGIRILNITNPSDPKEIHVNPIHADALFSSGKYLFVADRIRGLSILDISTPTQPKEVGFHRGFPGADSVFVSGENAFLSQSGYKLLILNVKNPVNPTVLWEEEKTSLEDTGSVQAVSGKYVYTHTRSGFRILQWSKTSEQPVEMANYSVDHSEHLFVSGSYLYLATGMQGLRIFDISQPSKPRHMSGADPGWVKEVLLVGDFAFITNGHYIHILRVAQPSDPKEVGRIDLNPPSPYSYGLGSAIAQDISFSNPYLLSTSISGMGSSSLAIHDVSNIAKPKLVGKLESLGMASALSISGNYAYILDETPLVIVDISDPSKPKKVGEYRRIPSALFLNAGIDVSEDYAYLLQDKLLILNVSKPSMPREVGTYPTYGNGIFVSGPYVFVAGGFKGLTILDVSNPQLISEVASYATPSGLPNNVFVTAGYAYVADGEKGGLRIFDVSHPSKPEEVGYVDTPGEAWSVFVKGKFAYVADGGGLRIYDVQNPTKPVEVGYWHAPPVQVW